MIVENIPQVLSGAVKTIAIVYPVGVVGRSIIKKEKFIPSLIYAGKAAMGIGLGYALVHYGKLFFE